ncbi:hypothetical protein M8J76_009235 [Diaphorina citri]|uniref:ATP-binding cassette sub-family H member 1 n=1 Tax=Diaphorina citri TaxID=121845 RepID=A0A3R5VSF8_DIACI|nr:hypothetical protein M8J76_009235 [Diaphorina citri]QAA95934.1 ATP-binding cassette sub-family H member 1 [Diaphorina citri]
MDLKDKCAIRVENAYKRHSSKLPYVLDKLCMTVQKSTIYSLLGASGCGKTTLLSCITGQNVLNGGNIHLSIISKKQLGFMPQQISLYPEFTIDEMICYYGLIYGMSLQQIKEKAEYLQALLHLNHFKRKCGSLSGGQQRRVSLAITLLHDPELLILDEPTSGIDPVIAEEIWNHLLYLAESGRTILITTHYIDEAKKSHMIGLMRKGILLEESPPKVLLEKYNMKSLEDVFLLLSSKQQHDRIEQRRKSIGVEAHRRQSVLLEKFELPRKCKRSLQSKEYFRGSRMKAQIWKHLLWMKGNPGVMAFMTLVPMLCILFFNWAVGHIPDQMPLGVVNKEANLSYCDSRTPQRINCTSSDYFSCIYLEKLREQSIRLIEFSDEETARSSAKRNRIWGFLSIPRNFTAGLELRLTNSMDMSLEDSTATEMGVELDKTDFIITYGIMRSLKRAFKSMVLSYTSTCDHNPRLADIPPFQHSFFYGNLDTTYDQFTGPAILILVIFYMPFLFTTSALIMEKSKGIIERSIIAGMTLLEVITAHLIVQFIVLLIQIILSLAMQYYVFLHPNIGDPVLVFILLILQGICGTLYGLLTSFVCSSDAAAGLFVIGTTIPFLFLSGFLWPIQAIQEHTRYLANFLPLTYPIDSFRSIVFRGFDIFHWQVYYGFLSSTGWIVGLTLVCWILLRYKNGLV